MLTLLNNPHNLHNGYGYGTGVANHTPTQTQVVPGPGPGQVTPTHDNPYQAPGSTFQILSVVIHKGVEVIVIGVGPIVSALSMWLGKGIDWAVINHMSQGVTSSTDPKIADVIRVSPSVTEITLGRQTMMCSMSWC